MSRNSISKSISVNHSTCENYDDNDLPSKGVNVVHLNIVSLPAKFDQLKHFIHDKDVHLMAICESRLNKYIADHVISI